MAETKQMPPRQNPNKLAMSKALGAAFLNHQVEQLEKTVSNGPTSGNWRARQQQQHGGGYANANVRGVGRAGGGPNTTAGISVAQRKGTGTVSGKAGGEVQLMNNVKGAGAASSVKDRDFDRGLGGKDSSARRRSQEGNNTTNTNTNTTAHAVEKDADVVVVDASVLIHALYQVKKWCRDGREEIVIVPLEALNTLDLLKKGTSVLAQRARAASRILEAQVGTNPRIRVQRDDAFVLWDKIAFKDDSDGENDAAAATKPIGNGNASPEWVRRTICCAEWEVEHAEETAKDGPLRNTTTVTITPSTTTTTTTTTTTKPKVTLAVLSTPPSPTTTSFSTSTSSTTTPSHTPTPVVPLPAPTPASFLSKHEPRCTGSLVKYWGAKAGIKLLEVDQTLPGRGAEDEGLAGGGEASSNSARVGGGGGGAGASKHFLHPHPHSHAHANGHAHRGRRGGDGAQKRIMGGGGGGGLVERPPAVMAMMEMVAQPSKVVRVLARGEKLDPDP